MPTVEQAMERLKRNGDQHVAVAIWSEDDVLGRAKERGISCTREQAQEILDEMDRKQDCELGITWITIDCFLDELDASVPNCPVLEGVTMAKNE